MIFGTVRIEREYLNARERNWNGWRKNGDTKKPINESLSLSLRFYHWFYQFLPTRSSHICSFDILESIKREGGCGYTRVKKRRNNEFDTMGEGRRRISSRWICTCRTGLNAERSADGARRSLQPVGKSGSNNNNAGEKRENSTAVAVINLRLQQNFRGIFAFSQRVDERKESRNDESGRWREIIVSAEDDRELARGSWLATRVKTSEEQ